ncbi:MAG: S-layer homology domain-containing protein [Desulfurispora sp.]|uniref:S-layer homology domain-containing protein n=1 Tax=Desulfurispora sp. TaxID=3014275 RepID=UPI00404A917B
MSKPKILLALSLLILCCLLLPAAAPAVSFNDLDRSWEWASSAVQKSSELKLMQGYPDGKFMPGKALSRLEAMAIVLRGTVGEDTLSKVDVAKSGIKLPAGMTWGQQYLVYAAQQGILAKETINQLKYNNAITRAEMAYLLAAALKLGKGSNTSLQSYVDAAKIGDAYKPYVAIVTEKKLMSGLPEKAGSSRVKFAPDVPLNRAQMAVLVARLAENNWLKAVGQTPTQGGGTTPTTPGSGSTTTTQPVQPDMEITGRVVSKTLTSSGWQLQLSQNGSYYTYSLASNVTITDSYGSRDIAALSNNTYIKAKIKSGYIYQVNILPGVTVKGKVTGTGSSSFTLAKSNGTSATYTYSSATVFYDQNGREKRFTIARGQELRVTAYNNEAIEISLVSEGKWSGTIKKVYADDRQLSIKLADGTSKTYDVYKRAELLDEDDDEIALDDLDVGDEVEFELDEDDQIVWLQVSDDTSSRLDYTGTVRSVDEDNREIKVRLDDGDTETYYVRKSATIEDQDGDDIDLADIEVGDEVTFDLNSSDEITKLILLGSSASSSSTRRGTVTALKTSSYIALDQRKYYLASSVRVYKDGDSMDIEDIMLGAEVKLYLNSSDKVTRIDITNDEDITVEGTVEEVRSGSNKITIEQSNGLSFTLPVSSSCTFKNTSADELGEVEKGWEVRLTLENGKVTVIKKL